MAEQSELDFVLSNSESITRALVFSGSLCHSALLRCVALQEKRDALLAACQRLLEIADRESKTDPDIVATDEYARRICSQARAAIALAEKESPDA